MEVMNLQFASDETVWVTWKHAAEEHERSLLHKNEVIGTYVSAGANIHLIAISTDCKRKRSIATLILSYTFTRETNRYLLKRVIN